MPDGNFKREELDPEKTVQLLEIELMQQRAARQKAKARRGGLRALSFLFLFLILMGVLALFVFFSPARLRDTHVSGQSGEEASPSPAATPH